MQNLREEFREKYLEKEKDVFYVKRIKNKENQVSILDTTGVVQQKKKPDPIVHNQPGHSGGLGALGTL